MNLVLLISTVWFALFGIYACAVLPQTSTTPSPSSNLAKQDDFTSDVGQEEGGRSLPSPAEKKLNENLNDHAGDHDQDQETKNSVKARKGVTLTEVDSAQAASEIHAVRNISTDRANTTIAIEGESPTNKTSERPSIKSKEKVTQSDTASSYESDKYSPYESESKNTGSSSSINSSKQENTSASSVATNSKTSASTESTSSKSSSKSSSINKKPLITYSIEDDPSLLNVPIVRQFITPLTPIDLKAEAGDSPYLPLPPSSDFVLDRTQSKREMYIFPLVVLIFMVPMVLGVGIIILRRVRDYWSTRHYRRMDFLVDGMYNT